MDGHHTVLSAGCEVSSANPQIIPGQATVDQQNTSITLASVRVTDDDRSKSPLLMHEEVVEEDEQAQLEVPPILVGENSIEDLVLNPSID